MLWTLLIFVLNLAISWHNAWAAGQEWAETRAMGGFPRLLSWCSAIMSAAGFTYAYTVLVAFIAGAAGYLQPTQVKYLLELGYVLVIFPILGSGLAIWIDSLVEAWKKRTLMTMGTAAWNTFAMAHNVYDAATILPDVLADLGDLFDGDDDDAKGKIGFLLILLVVAAAFAGIMTTCAILKSSARGTAERFKLERAQA